MEWGRLDEFQSALDRGLSTREVAEDLGIAHDSIMKGLREGKHVQERTLFMRMRAKELADRRVGMTYNWDRIRCVHGTWSSTGACEHGKIQGKKS